MNLPGSPIFAYISIIIALLVEGRYIYTILTGRTIPNFTGWFIISLSMSFLFITLNFIECSVIALLTFRHMSRLQKLSFYLGRLFHIRF